MLALAFPGLRRARPRAVLPASRCPTSTAAPRQSTTLTCDDPSLTGLSYVTDPSDDAAHGFVFYDGAGTVYYNANGDYKGPDSWTTMVQDNDGGSVNVSFSVDVTNQAPVCQAATITTTRGRPGFATFDCADGRRRRPGLPRHAAGPRHQQRRVRLAQLPARPRLRGHRRVHLLRERRCRGGPLGRGAVTVQNATPSCSGLRQQRDAAQRQADHRVGQLLDNDGDALTIHHTTPAHGTLGAFAYNPEAFSYQATYRRAASYAGPSLLLHRRRRRRDLGQHRLRPDGPRSAQCQQNGTFHTKVDQPLSVFVFCSDQDANDQDLTYTVVSGGGTAHGTLGTLQNSQIQYTPANGFTGTDGFSMRASDGALSDTYAQVIHVADTPLCTTPAPFSVRSGKSRGVDRFASRRRTGARRTETKTLVCSDGPAYETLSVTLELRPLTIRAAVSSPPLRRPSSTTTPWPSCTAGATPYRSSVCIGFWLAGTLRRSWRSSPSPITAAPTESTRP